MSPAPYCLPCNRHHADECPPGERAGAILGTLMLLLVSIVIGLAFAGQAVGMWFW
ncbi:hypothetical protein SEA_SCARLETT_52 [Mycobacterium phage Scarlett]|nr:hypothetical protein SEA_SCARLETT_52 [Mycobacterium phage Scarlett]